MKNESVKKSLEKSNNVLEEKRKMVKRKICIKNTHAYNNCYELRSRAINHFPGSQKWLLDRKSFYFKICSTVDHESLQLQHFQFGRDV